jgi:hypothetical protein
MAETENERKTRLEQEKHLEQTKQELLKQQMQNVNNTETHPSDTAKEPSPILETTPVYKGKAILKEDENSPLFKAYKERFPKRPPPEKRDDSSYLFSFNSQEEATQFFDDMAKANNKFLCQEEGKGFDGHNFFACGDGKLYQGSLQDIKTGLEKSIANDPTNNAAKEGIEYISSLLPKPNPATAYRGVLEDEKAKQQTEAPSPAPRPK